MPRFARLFEAAADTLNAYYAAVAERNLEAVMQLWIDEEFVSCIQADGAHLHGLEKIRAGYALQFNHGRKHIEALDVRVYDSVGTVVYAAAEIHRGPGETESMVFTTYVMVHEHGRWKIAHVHASTMPAETASQFAAKSRSRRGPLH
jgi:hypothetical protein